MTIVELAALLHDADRITGRTGARESGLNKETRRDAYFGITKGLSTRVVFVGIDPRTNEQVIEDLS